MSLVMSALLAHSTGQGGAVPAQSDGGKDDATAWVAAGVLVFFAVMVHVRRLTSWTDTAVWLLAGGGAVALSPSAVAVEAWKIFLGKCSAEVAVLEVETPSAGWEVNRNNANNGPKVLTSASASNLPQNRPSRGVNFHSPSSGLSQMLQERWSQLQLRSELG